MRAGTDGGRMATHGLQHPLGGRRRHERHQPALVGHVERIEAQQFAGGGHRLGHRNGRFVDLDAHAGVQGDLVQRGGQPAAGQIAKAMDVGAGGEHGFDQSGQRGTIALQRPLETAAPRGPT